MEELRTALKGAAMLAGCLVILNTIPTSQAAAPQAREPKRVPGELIVKFRSDASDAEIGDGLKKGKLRIKKHLRTAAMAARNNDGLTVVSTDLPEDEAIEALKNDPAIALVEPNYVYTHEAVSNDPYFNANNLWGMCGDLSTPANAYGSQAAEAWANGYLGTNSVFVGIIDSGVQVSHPDLSANMWINPHDPLDGIDNDGNGYIDDRRGWDFYGNRPLVENGTDDAHGTHVAGTIGAKGGNGVGVAGINWTVNMISARFMNGGSGTTTDAIEAIDYFVDLKERHGLNIVAVNASWGGGGYSQALHSAIIRAAKAGILFVAAAGNNGQNNDAVASYPSNINTTSGTSLETAANYNSVIAVAAIANNGSRASFSNYGATRVHIGAPGVSILSSYPGSTYSYMNGTSMATPHVTGAAALYASTHPGSSANEIRSALLNSALPTPSLAGLTSTGGRLNLSSVIAPTVEVVPAVPAAPMGVTVAAAQANVAGTAVVTVSWNPAADASQYIVKSSSSTNGPWAVAGTVTGTTFSRSVTANNATHYYTVSASNSSGQSANAVPNGTKVRRPAPGSLAARLAAATEANLTWQDYSLDEEGFRIEYYTGSTWAVLGSIAPNSTAVRVTGLLRGRTYQYRVVAYKGAVSTPASNVASVYVP